MQTAPGLPFVEFMAIIYTFGTQMYAWGPLATSLSWTHWIDLRPRTWKEIHPIVLYDVIDYPCHKLSVGLIDLCLQTPKNGATRKNETPIIIEALSRISTTKAKLCKFNAKQSTWQHEVFNRIIIVPLWKYMALLFYVVKTHYHLHIAETVCDYIQSH